MAINPVLHNKDTNFSTALKLYTNEVIKSFRERNVALETVKVRELTGGISAQFIVTGKANESDIQEHNRGDLVNTNLLENSEVVISLGKRYVHAHFSDDLDNTIAQYDLRSELSFQSAEVLATKIDKDIFSGIIHKAGSAPAISNGHFPAAVVTATGYSAATTAQDKGDALVEAFFQSRSVLNERNIAEEPVVFVSPIDYYNVVQSTRGVNADYTTGNGGIDTGKIRMVAGFRLGWTNHLDKTDQSANGGIDATKLLGLMYTKGVFGVVKAMDIKSEMNYDPNRLGWLLTSYYAMGMGVLDPSSLILVMAD